MSIVSPFNSAVTSKLALQNTSTFVLAATTVIMHQHASNGLGNTQGLARIQQLPNRILPLSYPLQCQIGERSCTRERSDFSKPIVHLARPTLVCVKSCRLMHTQHLFP